MAKFDQAQSQGVSVSGQKPVETLVNPSPAVNLSGVSDAIAGVFDTSEDLTQTGALTNVLNAGEAALRTFNTRRETGTLGEQTSPDVMLSDERDAQLSGFLPTGADPAVLDRANRMFTRLAAAYSANGGGSSGLLSQDDYGVIINSHIKKLIAQDPVNADEYIKLAKKRLGFDPTSSMTGRELAKLKAETKAPPTSYEREYANQISMDVPVEQAKVNALISEREKAAIQTNTFEIAELGSTERSLNSRSNLLITGLEGDVANNVQMRLRLGTANPVSLKASADADREMIHREYSAAIRDVRSNAKEGVDSSTAVQQLVDSRDQMLGWIEDSSIVSRFSRDNEFYGLVTQDFLNEYYQMAALQKLDPTFAAEFVRSIAEAGGNKEKLSKLRSKVPQFAGTEIVMDYFNEIYAANERIKTDAPASVSEEEKAADVDAAALQVQTDNPEKKELEVNKVTQSAGEKGLRRIGREGSLTDVLAAVDTDKAQASVHKNDKKGVLKYTGEAAAQQALSLQNIFDNVIPERTRRLLSLKDGKVVYTAPVGPDGKPRKPSRGDIGAKHLDAKRYADKMNQLISVNSRYSLNIPDLPTDSTEPWPPVPEEQKGYLQRLREERNKPSELDNARSSFQEDLSGTSQEATGGSQSDSKPQELQGDVGDSRGPTERPDGLYEDKDKGLVKVVDGVMYDFYPAAK